jgi:cell division protein FtsX
MKSLINIVLILVLSAIAQLMLPWWSIALVAFVIGYFSCNSGWQAFFAGFLALLLLWGGYSFFIDKANEQILSSKIAQLFTLSSGYLLVLITAVVGSLVAGLAALSGRLVKEIL